MVKKIVAYLRAHRALLYGALCGSAALIGGIIGGLCGTLAGGSIANLFGARSVQGSAASVIRANQSAIDADTAAQNLLRRAGGN